MSNPPGQSEFHGLRKFGSLSKSSPLEITQFDQSACRLLQNRHTERSLIIAKSALTFGQVSCKLVGGFINITPTVVESLQNL